MLVIYWLHVIFGWILAPAYYLWKAISFWPHFFWHLIGTKAKGRSVCSILTDPEDKYSTARKLKNCHPAGWIRPLWSWYMVFTTYQVHGVYAYLHQHLNVAVEESIKESAGPVLTRVWDPLRLAIPYEYLSARLPKPPDCYLAKLLTILLLLGLYNVPLVRGATHLTCLRTRTLLGDCASTVTSCIALATTPRPREGNTSVSFDTDGIPFIIDNSAMCIICNERSLFVGTLRPENYMAETVQATVSQKHYAGTIRLELVDDSNDTHVYEIPEVIYDPNTQFNLIGIPFLAAYFNDTNCSAGDGVDADGTTIKSSGCRSKFVWNHGRHVRNFTHVESTLPELVLYQGNGYYTAFCTRVQQRYNDAVAFAFSSAFSILPDSTDDPALVSDTEDSDDKDNGTLPSHLVEDNAMEWYTPPPQTASIPPITVDDPPVKTIPSPSTHRTDGSSFELSMSLSFYDGRGNLEMVVYEGVMPDGLTHTVRRKDGTRLHVHDAHLRLKLQANLSNIPKTPLDYCKEVGQGTSQDAKVDLKPLIVSVIPI